jgi:ABC-type polysaccharide/polyol phosphate transport system ATPase subunit
MENKNKIIISVSNVSKKFDLDYKKNEGALFNLLSFLSKGPEKKEIEALKDVSFEAMAGEVIGIIGRNGSGKSTLLRIIAEVYTPDTGQVKTLGNVAYLTGYGQGLSPKLTMRENIYLIGSLMGLGQKDIKKRFNEIVSFSGLKDFVDTKVYQLSSGMLTRLNFSITIYCLSHNEPDIILLDEVFSAGGDIDFSDKALAKMEELVKGKATVIMAGHDLSLMKKYCNKVIWLEKGKIAKMGEPAEVVESYLDSPRNKKI